MIDTVLPLPASLAIAAYTLAYTPPNSKLRPIAGLTIAVFNWVAAQSTIARGFPGFIGPEYILGWILACNNWLNLARLHYKPPAKGYEQPNDRLKWAIYQVFDTRWSVSSSQIPYFDKNRPQWVPSRRYFLLWKLWTMTWCGTFVYLSHLYEPLEVSDIIGTPAGFLYRLGDVTGREAYLRIYYGVEIMFNSYCCLCLMHAVCGFIAVLAFRDDPAGWRPLHGSPLEAMGMRGFYHKFWHHCMRKGFTTHSVYLVNDVLRLPRKNATARYLIVLCSFLISGLYHAALTIDIPWQCSMLQIPYQLKIVGAIVLEDVVSTLWKKFAPRSLRLEASKNAVENGSAVDSSTTSLSAGHDSNHKELRRRNEKRSNNEYPRSPMPVTPTISHSPGSAKTSINWVSVAIRGIAYLWTILFMIWANSNLVFATNTCVLNRVSEDFDPDKLLSSYDFPEPF